MSSHPRGRVPSATTDRDVGIYRTAKLVDQLPPCEALAQLDDAATEVSDAWHDACDALVRLGRAADAHDTAVAALLDSAQRAQLRDQLPEGWSFWAASGIRADPTRSVLTPGGRVGVTGQTGPRLITGVIPAVLQALGRPAPGANVAPLGVAWVDGALVTRDSVKLEGRPPAPARSPSGMRGDHLGAIAAQLDAGR